MNRLYTQLSNQAQELLQNEQMSKEALDFYEGKRQVAEYMFGYPSYNYALSPLTQYLLLLHYTSPFSNNCGDIDERGNYALDTKDMEKKIVGLYAKKFGMGDGFWGYITSGGSESNSCGITLAFAQNPNAILYYPQSAHYSVEKYAQHYTRMQIPTIGKDKLNYDAFFTQILKNYQTTGKAANIVLTHGTTKYGECDDIDAIVAFLREQNIPYYLHVDAALFGGIPNNQLHAPVLLNAKARGVNSVCVSLHKYVGFPDVKSVFVATQKPRGRKIAYIGQHDTTVSGSRCIPAFALYNHVLEQTNESDPLLYKKNVDFFENLLQSEGVPFYRAKRSNIFVFDAPSEKTCETFQLSCFDETEGNNILAKAHAIIFPSHNEKQMTELVKALKADLL